MLVILMLEVVKKIVALAVVVVVKVVLFQSMFFSFLSFLLLEWYHLLNAYISMHLFDYVYLM